MDCRVPGIPRGVKIPLVILAAIVLGHAFSGSAAAADCGGKDQTPCRLWQGRKSCDHGLKEDFKNDKCVGLPSCGALNQRPCTLTERIPSCDAGLVEEDKCRQVSGNFRIRASFGKCMHVPEESRANNVQLRTWECIDKTHLAWDKVEREGHVWSLRNRMTGKCAAVHKGQVHDGAAVVQWDCREEEHFYWTMQSTGESGGNLIVHKASGKCLHADSDADYAALTIRECASASRWSHELL